MLKNKLLRYGILTAVITVGLIGASALQAGKKKEAPAEKRPSKAKQKQLMQQMMKQRKQEAPDVSKKEMKRFAETLQSLQTMQRSMQTKMRKAVSDSGLSVEEYKQIAQAKQQGGKPGEGKKQDDKSIKKADEKKFAAAQQNLRKVQKNSGKKMRSIVKDNGFELQRFDKISRALRYDKELRQRFMVASKAVQQEKPQKSKTEKGKPEAAKQPEKNNPAEE